MKFVSCLLLALAFCGTAIAGDRWQYCSSADGSVRLSYGVLTVNGEEISYSGESKVLSTVKEEDTVCELKDSGEKVTMYRNVITVEEITYALEETGPAAAMKEIVLCQAGMGSLIPQDLCKE